MIANGSDHRYTIAEFEVFIALPENEERRFELIDGEIIEKDTTEERGVLIVQVAVPLGLFIQEHKLGRAVVSAYHHAANDDYNDLLPEICFTRNERLLPIVTEGAVPQIPDLVVGVPSRQARLKDLRVKAQYYLSNEGQIVWIVLPNQHVVEVCTPTDRLVLAEGDVLDGGDVLPGFTLPVRDIFDVK
jgi:Uma2 family endonuclease